MTGRIWIGGMKDGRIGIGAHNAHGMDVEELIWPSQMQYRVLSLDSEGAVYISTRTDAVSWGHKIIRQFPTADGRLGRKRSGRGLSSG